MAERSDEAPAALSEDSVLAAVEARRQSILEHAATVSTGTLLDWLVADLGLASDAALRPHRRAIKRRAVELLEEQGQVCTERAPTTAADLPTDVLQDVLALLDHDSLFSALQVCRAWRAAGAAAGAQEALWQRQCAARGWAAAAQPALLALLQQHQQRLQELRRRRRLLQQRIQQQQVPLHEALPLTVELAREEEGVQQAQQRELQFMQLQVQAGSDWRWRYRLAYGATCFDCFQPTDRHTLTAGSLRVRLCRTCSAGYDSPQPHHRLLAASTAKRQCCLKDEELAALPHCVEPNPINPSFAPMRLYRRLDVRRAAVDQFGSWEAVQREHRRRITRR